MKKLPTQLKKIIKKQTFSLNTLESERSWRGGMEIDYRITMVKAEEEDWYDEVTPINNSEWGSIHVNLKVRGSVQVKPRYNKDRELVEISKGTKTKANYWGGYGTKYDELWGHEINKRVRKHIRAEVQSEVKDYLKLMGITSRETDGITIKKITWEK